MKGGASESGVDGSKNYELNERRAETIRYSANRVLS